ncbi:hypothetical protein C8F04DRAFT_1076673 [Mycena alexandri]|uniref:Integrase core domain-containing protein n=1 Tax=Mycena alexandri TaxID=1745969 RepID=A0AAD6TC60_9AGAR|nr:hypothetical protein C8F04DRAFT_1076673 [Mycena alexandri]
MSPKGKKGKGKARKPYEKPRLKNEVDSDPEDLQVGLLGRYSTARNPSGKNQHAPAPTLGEVAHLIRAYHKDNPKFKYDDYIEAFANEHDLVISRTKLSGYLKELGLYTTSRGNRMPIGAKNQLILDELANDPCQTRGPRVIKEALNLDGHKIGRDDISNIMHDLHPEGFNKRNPRAKKKKIIRQPLTAVGPDEEWSVDGHDKLNSAGFPIYGIRDKWGGKFLHYCVVPSNRYASVVGVLFLECAKKRGGVPVQVTSDRGSETRDAYAFQTALRETFAPDLLNQLIPSWRFLPSPHNITVESGWRPLFYTWGVNVLEFFNAGLFDGFFEAGNPLHEQTSNWIWFPAIQRDLDRFCHQQNNHRVRYQADKKLPSGGTPNEFDKNPQSYGGTPSLIKVDAEVIQELLDGCEEGYKRMRYVDEDFADLAEEAYTALGRPGINLQTAWGVFRAMIGQLQ